jgi:hypothetical protein
MPTMAMGSFAGDVDRDGIGGGRADNVGATDEPAVLVKNLASDAGVACSQTRVGERLRPRCLPRSAMSFVAPRESSP